MHALALMLLAASAQVLRSVQDDIAYANIAD